MHLKMNSFEILHHVMKSKNRNGNFAIGNFFIEFAQVVDVSRTKEMMPQKCYDNAVKMVTGNCFPFGRYQYCEGVFMKDGWPPIDHAWVYDTEKRIYVDPTIPHDQIGSYIGLRFPLELVLECHSGDVWRGSVIDTLWRGYSMSEQQIKTTYDIMLDANQSTQLI